MPRARVADTGNHASAQPLIELGSIKGESRSARNHAQVMTTKIGLQVPENLSFEEWERAGFQMSRVVDSFTWCLGDWLVFGQRKYADRYRLVIDTVGLNYQTLRNYASVARRVPVSRRRWRLSFQHHAEVASLSEAEQELWLARAEQAGWSRNRLRQHIRSSRLQEVTVDVGTAVIPKVSAPRDRVDLWRRAAEQSSHEFESWIVVALDRAAAQELGDELNERASTM